MGSWGFYLPLSPILLRSGAHPNPVLWDNLEGWDRVRGRLKRDGMDVYLRLIRVAVWEKSTQRCKGITLQLKIN